ncbi:hypothetical protein AZH51_05890 [Branchiibius sp. NY16-3462-2]|nr:hypothetical protein AZH51_05890 [Branchiibius sp. NY16-3462-2]
MMAGMDVDFELLEDFLAVAQEGTTVAAARARHVSQPALSARIARLEKVVGTTLFDRVPQGMRLTADGQTFLPYAERALAAVRDGVAALAGSTPLRVAVVDDELAVPARVIAALGGPVQVIRAGEAEQDRLVRDGQVDVLVTGDQAGRPAVRLGHENLALAVPADDALAALDEVDLKDTGDRVHYLPREAFAPHWVALLRRIYAEAGIEPRTYAAQADSSTTPLRWVAAGECVAISLAGTPVPAGVRLVPLKGSPTYDWFAVAANDHSATRAALDRLQRSARKLAGIG